MINNYFVLHDNEQKGPFTHEELMDMGIKADAYVLSPLAVDWQYASQLPEFFLYFQSQGIYVPTKANQAGFWWRLLAYVIDYVLTVALIAVPGIVIEVFSEATGSSGIDDLEGAFNIIGVLIYLIYHPIFESLKTQGSIGKIVCKLAVVNAAGERITFLNALGRNLGKIISSLLCGLGFLNVLWDSQAQAWHDKFANVYVVRKGV